MKTSTKEDFYDYEKFVEKFKPKKTTDDCYTPPAIYEVVAEYVSKEYGLNISGAAPFGFNFLYSLPPSVLSWRGL